MIVELHLCGPGGDVRRQQLARLLNELKQDNCCVINAMLNAGESVPDTVIELGLDYDPAQGVAKQSERQPFYGMRKMVELGTFRCGDASAYEAAVLETKYGIPTMVLVVPQGKIEFHGIFVTSTEVVDPTENWLRHWEARMHPQSVNPWKSPAAGLRPVEQLPMCSIENGQVECTGMDDHTGCCVTRSGRWRCPQDHPLHGVDAEVKARRTRGGKHWALVGPDRIPVPVCPSVRSSRR
jgi:hypothetical protein